MRCRFDVSIWCYRNTPTGKGAWDLMPCLKCPKFPAKQAIFNNQGKVVKNISIKEISEGASDRTPFDDIPDIVKVTAVNASWAVDTYGKNCLTITYEWKKGKFTQKYTPMHLVVLHKAMLHLRIGDLLKADSMTLKKQKFNIGNERWFPVAQVK